MCLSHIYVIIYSLRLFPVKTKNILVRFWDFFLNFLNFHSVFLSTNWKMQIKTGGWNNILNNLEGERRGSVSASEFQLWRVFRGLQGQFQGSLGYFGAFLRYRFSPAPLKHCWERIKINHHWYRLYYSMHSSFYYLQCILTNSSVRYWGVLC